MTKELPEDFPSRYGGGAAKDTNGRWKIAPAQLLSVGITIIGWVVSLLLVYAAMNTRIAVTETKVDQLQLDVTDLRKDVKALLTRP